VYELPDFSFMFNRFFSKNCLARRNITPMDGLSPDVLSRQTFCPYEHFVHGRYVSGRLSPDVLSPDVLSGHHMKSRPRPLRGTTSGYPAGGKTRLFNVQKSAKPFTIPKYV
jgi:hypothetical protein